LINLTPADSGIIPLLANRIASSTLLGLAVLGLVLYRASRQRTPRLPGLTKVAPVWGIIVGAGVLDVLANVVVLWGLRVGELSVMSVLIALYPAGTILLASVVLKERIATVQWFGLGLALLASALLAS